MALAQRLASLRVERLLLHGPGERIECLNAEIVVDIAVEARLEQVLHRLRDVGSWRRRFLR